MIDVLFVSANKTGDQARIVFQSQLREESLLGWGELPVQGCVDVLIKSLMRKQC